MKPLLKFFGYAASAVIGYHFGTYQVKKNLLSDSTTARDFLPSILDAAKIPHGDLAVPSYEVESGRYIISRWQRSAAGAMVIITSKNEEGDLYIALGEQRGKLAVPQGYMETPLPKEDLTGLREKSASRKHAQTGQPVPADMSIEDNAVREVWEELGLKIKKEDLVLVSVKSGEVANPIVPTIAVVYKVFVDGLPKLGITDDEFAHDDLSAPKWYKVSDISCSSGECYVNGHNSPIKDSEFIFEALDEIPVLGSHSTIEDSN